MGPLLNDPAKSGPAHQRLAGLLVSAGKHRAAASHYQAARSSPELAGEATVGLARCLIAMGETERAIQTLEEETGHGRATPPVRELLGVLYESTGQPAKCIEVLQSLRAEGQDTFELHRALGSAQAQAGDYAEAAASFQRALAHRPRDAETENNLGWAYAQQLADDKAEQHLVAALEIEPALVEARRTLVMVYRRQGRTAEVVAQLEAILAAQTGDDQDLRALIRASLSSPDRKLSDTTVKRVTEIQTTDPVLLGAAGALLIQQARYSEAVQLLRRALERSNSDASLHNNLGVALERLGQLKDAMVEYRTAHHLRPDMVEAERNRQRVEDMLAREAAP